MSLKNDIEMVKEELSSEEKFFEKAVVTERFVKKYKNVMIGAVVGVVIAVAGNIVYTISEQNRIVEVNKTLATLEKDPQNTTVANQLKSLSPNLYDVWKYSQAVATKDVETLKALQNSQALIVSDLASYEVAQNLQDTTKLNEYASKESSIYTDLAQVQSAVLLINKGENVLAREKLSTINEESSLYKIAKALLHYGVK